MSITWLNHVNCTVIHIKSSFEDVMNIQISFEDVMNIRRNFNRFHINITNEGRDGRGPSEKYGRN